VIRRNPRANLKLEISILIKKLILWILLKELQSKYHTQEMKFVLTAKEVKLELVVNCMFVASAKVKELSTTKRVKIVKVWAGLKSLAKPVLGRELLEN